MTTTTNTQEAAAMPLETYITSGQREFAHYARKLAEIEQAADLEPGSLVESLLTGIDYRNAFELTGYIKGGWDLSQPGCDIEAALRPLVERWEQEELTSQ